MKSEVAKESTESAESEKNADSEMIEHQNTLKEREQHFEVEEQTKGKAGIVERESNDEVTLADFEEAYHQNQMIPIAHKWVTIPEKSRERFKLLKAFFSEKLQRLHKQLTNLGDEIQETAEQAQRSTCQRDFSKIKDKRLVFCTMTGCAIFHELLEKYRPTVLVVEEAAEIPEPCMVSALFPSVRRVVMVGDEQQLQASVQSHDLEKSGMGLETSAFERLINLKLEHKTLKWQNRMQPELTWMIQDYYDGYESNMALIKQPDASILNTLGPLRVFWWTHDQFETSGSGRGSHSNRHEVEMVHNVCRALITSHVDPKSIVVLTGYAGQKREIQVCQKGTKERKCVKAQRD